MLFLPPRQANDQSPRFIGLDLAKRETQLAVLNAEGLQMAAKRFATTRDCTEHQWSTGFKNGGWWPGRQR